MVGRLRRSLWSKSFFKSFKIAGWQIEQSIRSGFIKMLVGFMPSYIQSMSNHSQMVGSYIRILNSLQSGLMDFASDIILAIMY